MAIELNPSDWNLENSVALGREGTGLATIIKQPTLKELATSPYEALARKKAATVAKPDMSLYKDLTNPIALTGIYEVDKPEFVERVNGFVEKSAKLYADRSNGNIKEEDAQKLYTELAKERNQILSDIDRSKQDNLVYPKYQLELANKSHLYNPESKNYLETEMALPLSQRKPNLSIAKGDYFDYNKYVRDGMGKNWETWSRGSFSGRGGGSSKGATEFDENKARASWQAFAVAQSNDPKLANFIGNAADKMEKEFNKDAKLQKLYGVSDWFDLHEDLRAELSEKKAEQMAVNISKELFVKNSKSLSRGDRPKDGNGNNNAPGTSKYNIYFQERNADGTYKLQEVFRMGNPKDTKAATEGMLSKNFLYKSDGTPIPVPLQLTGNIIKNEGGDWMIEYQAMETLDSDEGKYTQGKTYYTPYSQKNKDNLKHYGYDLLDEIAPPDVRKQQYENYGEPESPESFNTKHHNQASRDEYKAWYDKFKQKKAAGWSHKNVGWEALVKPTQPKKVGTYNPLTGQIDFA